MKFKHLLTLVIVCLMTTVVSAQKKSQITSAEEMVVYNKQHNKPQYEGLIVVYNYELQNSSSMKSQELLSMARTKFIDVINAEIRSEGKKQILSISTEGTLDNNPIFYDFLYKHKIYLIQGRREMLLK